MIGEDYYSRTPADAAAYERYRSQDDFDYDDADYDRYDAMADAADDAWEERVAHHLAPMVNKALDKVYQLADEIDESGVDQPHPWTLERSWVALLHQDEDACQEAIEEYYREDAEEYAREDARMENDRYYW